jgi:hypothetical protein
MRLGTTAEVLVALVRAGAEGLPLFADCLFARLPLADAEWQLVPSPCPGLGQALPAALASSPAQAHSLVQHLPSTNAERLRVASLSLARAQKRLGCSLPLPIVWRMLALSVA